MKTFGTNNVNDLYRGRDGNIAIVSDLAAVERNCKTAMQAQRGEMVYRVDDGMPTRATAFDGFRPAQFEAGARAVIMRVAGVRSIESFTVRKVNDAIVYDAEILTIYGKTVVTDGL